MKLEEEKANKFKCGLRVEYRHNIISTRFVRMKPAISASKYHGLSILDGNENPTTKRARDKPHNFNNQKKFRVTRFQGD